MAETWHWTVFRSKAPNTSHFETVLKIGDGSREHNSYLEKTGLTDTGSLIGRNISPQLITA